ncbi:hypothetical protein [Burkholderia cenocepacia]|uniref:hypothetical protein n=1 Tax=Burkholderia cenocepacia TaxID=95486 RepID=UPI000F5C244E|nr:hypothetical protein [Burkholderia cenocepacia]
MKAKSKFIFFPDNKAPRSVRATVAVYWIVFSVSFLRIVTGMGVPPFNTASEREAAITLLGLLSVFLISYAFVIMRLSAGKLWARNLALCVTTFLIVATLYHLFSDGLPSLQNNVVGLINIALETGAGLFLLTSRSAAWFKSRIG